MKQAIRQLFFALFAALAALPLRAEDIDLFMGAQTVQTDRPNVLIILDNTANWNTAHCGMCLAAIRCARSWAMPRPLCRLPPR